MNVHAFITSGSFAQLRVQFLKGLRQQHRHMSSGAVKGLVKKAAATAAATATSLAWKRLSWQARAVMMGGSFALGAARKLNGIRQRLTGGGGGGTDKGRRRIHTYVAAAQQPALGATAVAGAWSPAAAALIAQQQARNPIWAPAVRQALSRAQ